MPRKSKNERSPRQVMLMAFWDCRGLVYTEFGPDARKGKRNVTQDIYFDILMYFRNVIQSKGASTLSTTCRLTCQSTLSLHKCRLSDGVYI